LKQDHLSKKSLPSKGKTLKSCVDIVSNRHSGGSTVAVRKSSVIMKEIIIVRRGGGEGRAHRYRNRKKDNHIKEKKNNPLPKKGS